MITKNAEILVERFDNGIGIQWSDPEEVEETSRLIAKEDDKDAALGSLINSDVNNLLDQYTGLKVKIKLEYELIY